MINTNVANVMILPIPNKASVRRTWDERVEVLIIKKEKYKGYFHCAITEKVKGEKVGRGGGKEGGKKRREVVVVVVEGGEGGGGAIIVEGIKKEQE